MFILFMNSEDGNVHVKLGNARFPPDIRAIRINNFTWNYSEPGHGKGAPDGVGVTLKRSADQAVAEGKDVTDLNVLKNVLSSKCPPIMLIEASTAEINYTDNLIKKSKSISTFPGTQKIDNLCSQMMCLNLDLYLVLTALENANSFILVTIKLSKYRIRTHLQYQRDVKEKKLK
ncbi:hypothetical protein JTB14_017015 [Gonioctena quinquepunctata]|nr:hypothetical protein JTB14_017015 [Gonioctena quinquepunctata]